jgi:dolichyl-phosphate-mannose-protein mannosyltransferase
VRARLRARDADPWLAWAGTLGVTLLALFLRLRDLGRPDVFAFDETYYAKDAWSLVNFGFVQGYADGADESILGGQTEGLWNGDPSMVVHPELGKWLIGLGELAFGMNPFGWRVASAVTGALMVLVMVRLARRVTRSTALGLFAGLLLTFEGQHLVLSRLALLDIFLAFFVLCAVSCTVADRDWTRARLAEILGETRLGPRDWGPMLWWRPWRLAAGVFWGAAISTKWTALFALAAFGILMWLWDAGARRSFGVRLAVLRSALMDATPALAYVVLLPAVLYLLSWTGWLLHAGAYEQTLSDTQYGPYWGSYLETDAVGFFPELWQSLRSLGHYHHDVYAFHTQFLDDSTHSYQSSPWGWFWLNRPVGVATELDIPPGDQGCAAAADSTCLRQVLLLGNPVVWWAGSLALLWSLVAGVVKRDWRHLLVLVGVAATWLPWFRYADRPIFSYYSSLSLPFLVLSLTLLVGGLAGQGTGSPRRRLLAAVVAGALLGGTVLAFAWFWPVWTDGLLTREEWLQRMWFSRWI